MLIGNSKLMQARRSSKFGELQAPQMDIGMINSDMPPSNVPLVQNDATLAAMSIDIESRQALPSIKLPSSDLTVQIPSRKKVSIVELPNSTNSVGASDSTAAEDNFKPEDWLRCTKASISALHSSFTNKYSIKVELFDAESKSIGVLETGLYHNPGNYCFFCLDYIPDTLKIRRGPRIACVTPYCSCCPKTVYDYNQNRKEAPQILGRIKSLFCSTKVDIYNQQGELTYGLKDRNCMMRNCRFLVEAPFLPLCIPYKLAICCCMDVLWSKRPKPIRMYDYKTKTYSEVGTVTNFSERSNEWQEVTRKGEKINQYKGEEIFLCKQFEINMPSDADTTSKKLLIGALIAEIPSTIDRCAC